MAWGRGQSLAAQCILTLWRLSEGLLDCAGHVCVGVSVEFLLCVCLCVCLDWCFSLCVCVGSCFFLLLCALLCVLSDSPCACWVGETVLGPVDYRGHSRRKGKKEAHTHETVRGEGRRRGGRVNDQTNRGGVRGNGHAMFVLY